jgi:hypothetical protein
VNALHDELRTHGLRVAKAVRGHRAARRALRAWAFAARWIWLAPAALSVVLALALAADLPFAPSFVVALACTFVPWLVYVASVHLRTSLAAVDAEEGLARLDHELGLEGRLRTAYEFLARERRDGFMQAAIEDAQGSVARAATFQLPAPPARTWPAHTILAPLGAALWCVLLAVFGHVGAVQSGGGVETRTSAGATATRDEVHETPPRDMPPREARPPTAMPPRTPAQAAQGGERPSANEPKQQERESSGKTGEGASANATPTTASSDSRGFTSTQSDPTQAGDPGKQPTKPAKPKPKDDATETPKKKLEESGSTAGKGTGSGSSKNPGATQWQSKDQVSTDEEQPLNEDENVDDDTDESEARGGLQPSLRDRRPAVNRDLQIGFGNRPNPDANGRGGPSEQKKSRGVASLVLGVPIPDHVKGQPNPGRTKITQERVQPRADTAAPIDAQERRERASPIGPITRRTLTPWMRDVVRTYFSTIRNPPRS